MPFAAVLCGDKNASGDLHPKYDQDSPDLAVGRVLDLATDHAGLQMLVPVCSVRSAEQDAMTNDHGHFEPRVLLQWLPLLVQRSSWEHRESSECCVN